MTQRIRKVTTMNNRWLDNRWSKIFLAGATSAALLGGCAEDVEKPDGGETPVATTEFSLVPAQSCTDVRDNVVDALTEELLRQRYDYGGWLEGDAFGGNNAAPTQGADDRANGDSPDDYTTTNNQEAGVDEADFVKTDGEHIYVLNGYDLVIVDSWPADQASEIGRFTIGGDNFSENGEWREDYQYSAPSAMFLDGDYVAVFSQVYESTTDASGNHDYFQGTRITVIDVSDRTAPRLDRAIDIEGWYNDARMIGGEVYVVSNGWIEYPDGFWDLTYDDGTNTHGLPAQEWDADEARKTQLKNQARPIARQLVSNLLGSGSITDRLPIERQLNSNLEVVSERTLYSCTDLYMPQAVAQAGILNISHFDLDQKSAIKSTGLLSNGWEVYSSEDNLYVAQSSGWWWWGWGGGTETAIHKFGLNGPNGNPAYVASGLVDGWLLNQFSMSEHNGFLRVATTDNQWAENATTGEWEQTGGNHVIVLEQNQGQLKETSSIRNLAPGEQVFAARFLGDKGYVVTFEQTDPLFTFDLSDPYNAKLKGELKINGFSSYIHPMGQNHLLTIGQDATDTGEVLGVHLQIFDVSDMTNPVRTFQEKISTGAWSSWSEAMWDHHAFTYHPGKEILAVPVNIHEWSANNGQNFSGLLVYKASATTGFAELGRINHADLVSTYHCGYSSVDCYEYNWWTSVRRSIFIEDNVFSISDMGIKVNDLNSPATEHTSMILRQQ